MNNTERPPLGIIPPKFCDFYIERVRDLSRSIYQYIQYDKTLENKSVYIHWAEELHTLLTMME